MSEHELWNELGNLYFMSGTLNQAAYAYRRAIQLDGGFGRPYCNLALTYVKQGRFEEAVQLYQRSIELLVDNTERAITWYRLGDVYRHLKDYRDAILAYQAADMLDADLSPNDKETGRILYGGAEVRLVQAGAISPSIPESVPSPEASIQPVEDMPKAPASATEADTETPPVEEAHTGVDECMGAVALVEAAPAPAAEAAADTASRQQAPTPVVQAVMDMAPVHEAWVIEAAVETAPVPESPASVDEAIVDVVPVQEAPASADEAAAEAAPVEQQVAVSEDPAASPEETFETALPVDEPAPEPQVLESVNDLPVAGEPEAGLDESRAEAASETAPAVDEPTPEIELEAPEMVAEGPVDMEAETTSAPDIEVSPIDEAPILDAVPAAVPADEQVAEIAMSAAEWEEYVLSSLEQETDVQPLDDSQQALDAWLPEVEMELADVETGQPGGELPVLEQELVSDDFPASAEVPPFSPRYPAGTAQNLVSEDLLTAIPSLTLDFREEDTQPVFIVPEEMEQGFSVVQVESGTTDVACAVESEEPDAEMQGILAEIERFKRAVQSNPRNAPAWDTLGTLYKAARKYWDAIMAYQQAVSVDPSKPHYHHHLGILYAIEGRDEDAIKAFQDVIELDPNHSLANATLGGYYRKMGLEELAQKHLGKAMKNFYTSENEYNRACLEALCGNTEQSLELLRIALKNKQTYVDWVLRDPDLDSIRRDPRFKQLISDYATW